MLTWKKLKVRFKSQSMDDKWEMLIEDLDENRNLPIYIFRDYYSYSRSAIKSKYFMLFRDQATISDGGSSNTYPEHQLGREKGAVAMRCRVGQGEAIILPRGHLSCEFETLPHFRPRFFWILVLILL